ncbi:MAG: helix-turn-helix domain-containing protein [Terrimicrobiaceae bacterium]
MLQQRIAEARRLLLLSNTPLVGIAFECGFQSVGRFYQAFKTQCKCSPGAYRRNHS